MRKAIALVLYSFAAVAFAVSFGPVYRAYLGVPDGLTRGRSSVALPGGGRLSVLGGFVRRVDGTDLLVRSLSPFPVLQFRNRGNEDTVFSVTLVNVKPSALIGVRIDETTSTGEPQPLALEPAGANAVRFPVSLPAGAAHAYSFGQRSAEAQSARFFVFGGVRDGLDIFERLIDIANEESPDFIVGLGHTYYRADTLLMQDIDRRLERLRVPVYLIQGEIELRTPEESPSVLNTELGRLYTLDRHPSIFGASDNVFEFSDWRFVFLMNSRPHNGASLRWLRSLPSGDPERTGTVFFTHIPPFDPRDDVFKEMTTGSPREHERVRDEMHRLGTRVAFFGHYRGYAEGAVGSIPCYVTSAAGVKLPRDQTDGFLDVRLQAGDLSVTHRRIPNGRESAAALGTSGPLAELGS